MPIQILRVDVLAQNAWREMAGYYRNWKILLKEIDESSYTINNMAYPTFYNLLVDPKEEVPELNYLNDTWVDFPLFQVIEDHEASIEADAGAPGP